MSEIRFWRYSLPSINGAGWAIVVLGSDGFFATVSDWGNFSFRWDAPGCADFRDFIVKLNPDYVRSKLDPSEVFDEDETQTAIRALILQRRRNRQIEREEARDAIDAVANIGSEYDLWEWLREHGDVLGDYCSEDICRRCPAHQVTGFVTKALPRLQEAIRSELQAERAGAREGGR